MGAGRVRVVQVPHDVHRTIANHNKVCTHLRACTWCRSTHNATAELVYGCRLVCLSTLRRTLVLGERARRFSSLRTLIRYGREWARADGSSPKRHAVNAFAICDERTDCTYVPSTILRSG